MSESRLQIPGGVKFGTVYADPPWALDKPGTEFRRRRLHYDRMSLDEIKAIPVADFTTPDAHLWLWSTNTHLRVAFDVVEAWGFEYKVLATWRKNRLGNGWWLRSRTEHLLFAAKSTRLRHNPGSFSTEITGKQDSVHGKPSKVYEMIEALSPGPYLEIFARGAVERGGWDHIGSDGVPADAFGQIQRHDQQYANAVKLDQTDGIVRGVGGLEIHAEQPYTLLRKQIIGVPVTALAQNGRKVLIEQDGKRKWVSIDSLRAHDYVT